MTEQKENLKELMSSLLGSDDADRTYSDIRLGDDIFRNYPLPEPEADLINNLKAQFAFNIKRKRRIAAFRITTAVAAVLIAAALVTIVFFANQPSQTRQTAQTIFHDDALENDPELSALMAQVNEIADQIQQIRLDEYDQHIDNILTQEEIEEMEMVANNTDFWKG